MYLIGSLAIWCMGYRRVELLVEVYFYLGVISISKLMLSSSLVSVDVHSHLIES
jgi:hypothetical protein